MIILTNKETNKPDKQTIEVKFKIRSFFGHHKFYSLESTSTSMSDAVGGGGEYVQLGWKMIWQEAANTKQKMNNYPSVFSFQKLSLRLNLKYYEAIGMDFQ